MTTIDLQKPVLVTGASGYIAGWIVRYLLEAGHTVHGTVRDPGKHKGLEHLHALTAEHDGRLRLFKADLLDDGSFDEATAGCELVMHTASPFVISGIKDAHEELVRPALEGTRNVLGTVNRTPSVKRVVLTSSYVAIFGDNADARNVPGGVFTEEHWNTTSTVDHQPYPYSKTVAEREAWKICEAQDRWDMVTINPGFVLGPSLTNASASTSMVFIKQLTGGAMFPVAPELWMGVADVRDVAMAHLKAGFTPQAEGRHIVNAADTTPLELGRLLRKRFGSRNLTPRTHAPKAAVKLAAPIAGLTREYVELNVGHRARFDNSKSIRALGLEYRSLEDTICDHYQQMLDDRR